MTADQCGGDDKSHSSKFADGASKACEIQRYSRQKTARQRNKNSKHGTMWAQIATSHIVQGLAEGAAPTTPN